MPTYTVTGTYTVAVTLGPFVSNRTDDADVIEDIDEAFRDEFGMNLDYETFDAITVQVVDPDSTICDACGAQDVPVEFDEEESEWVCAQCKEMM